MAKRPTRSPTHEDVPPARLASIGLELEEIADGEEVELGALIELAEDRGRPPSHYLAGIPLATELKLGPAAPTTVHVCAGICQSWGALDLLDHLVERTGAAGGAKRAGWSIVPVSCLDRCDQAPAVEIRGAHGQLVIAPASKPKLDEALAALVGETGS